MHKNHSIKVDGLTRVEGHGNIVVNIKKGRVEELRLEIIESPRFFEEKHRRVNKSVFLGMQELPEMTEGSSKK